MFHNERRIALENKFKEIETLMNPYTEMENGIKVISIPSSKIALKYKKLYHELHEIINEINLMNKN